MPQSAVSVTPEIETVAKKENRPVEFIMERVAKGTIAIAGEHSIRKSLSAEAVGDGTRVKINVDLGISGRLQGLRDGVAQGAHGR